MCGAIYRAQPYQLALLIKKSLNDDIAPLQYSTKTFITLISPLSMLYLQRVLLIHLKKCVFHIICISKLSLHVSSYFNLSMKSFTCLVL